MPMAYQPVVFVIALLALSVLFCLILVFLVGFAFGKLAVMCLATEGSIYSLGERLLV
jgi:hypothetical protein